jgi:hypothetical protein
MRSGIVFLITLVLSMRVAHADSVDTLIKQLGDSSKNVRLAAALNLAKLADQKAVLPLAKTVTSDDDASVRAAAAVALGKTVNSSTKDSIKKLAIANLKSAENDSSDTVKSQAKKALDTITGGGSGGGSTGVNTGTSGGSGKGGIYVNIGPMSSKTTSSKNDKLRALMVKTTEKTLGKVASNMQTTWSGGVPSKSALASKGVAGFYVDGTLNTLDVKTSGGGATISCKVSMLLADFPDKSVFGFLNGGASVSASSSQSDQDLASEDCVTAVIENLIANKIVPTIKSKVP